MNKCILCSELGNLFDSKKAEIFNQDELSLFEIKKIDEDNFNVRTPFVFVLDGEVIFLKIIKTRDGVFLTDSRNGFNYLISKGITLSKKHFNLIKKICSYYKIVLTDDLIMEKRIENKFELNNAIYNMSSVMNAIGHYEVLWRKEETSNILSNFENAKKIDVKKIVGEIISENIDKSKILYNQSIEGISGKITRIPYALDIYDLFLIKPLSVRFEKNKHIAWSSLDNVVTSMLDLEAQGYKERYVVLNDHNEMSGRDKTSIIKLLTESANVVILSEFDDWIKGLPA